MKKMWSYAFVFTHPIVQFSLSTTRTCLRVPGVPDASVASFVLVASFVDAGGSRVSSSVFVTESHL